MIRILMSDLGDTLTHNNVLFPHVREALEALTGFETAAGEPLVLCLVSDFRMPEPPPTPKKIDAIFHDYLAILDQLGLTPFFEPVKQHVTLSTHAGANKPDRRVFETALRRLKVQAGLAECLFITEDTEHIAKCQGLGMQTLQFGGPDGQGGDFQDWSEAPLLIARRVAPDRDLDLELALNVRLAITHHLQSISIKGRSADGWIQAQAKRWHPITDPKLGSLDGVHVELPVNVEIRLDAQGHVQTLRTTDPPQQALAEATHFVRTLVANQQIGPQAAGATHQVEEDAQGHRCLKRKRFSAI